MTTPQNWKEYELIDPKPTVEELADVVSEFFPDNTAVIVYGSFGDDYIAKVSDIDIIIIGPTVSDIENRLANFVSAYPEIDPLYFDEKKISKTNFEGIKNTGKYELHGFDLYRIKTQGKIIRGEQKYLDMFPQVSIDEALCDTLPYVRDTIIPILKNNLNDNKNTFLQKNLDKMIVILRALFTIETNKYGSKSDALEYIIQKYPEFSPVVSAIKNIYINAPGPYNHSLQKETEDLFKKVEDTISKYFTSNNIQA